MFFETPYIPILLLFSLNSITSASISSMNETNPFRTGNIYAVNSPVTTLNEETNILFDSALEVSPSQIVLSPRVLQSSPNTLCFDYKLKAINLSSTGFVFQIQLSQTYSITYTKIIVNYWTNSPLNRLISTSLDNATQSTTMNTSGIVRKWTLNVVSITDLFTTDCKAQIFFNRLCICAKNNNLTISQQFPIYNRTTKQIIIQYLIYCQGTYEILLNGIIYDSQFLNNSYSFSFTSINLRQVYSIVDLTDTYSYSTLFIGIGTMQTNLSLITTIGYSFGFENQPQSLDSFEYRQSHPKTYLIRTQQGQSNIRYSGRIAYYRSRVCNESTEFIYYQLITQLCHDKCPIGKFNDDQRYCWTCTNLNKCSNIQNCTECLENGCEQGYYFDTRITPYRCTSCQSELDSCLKCYVNLTGGPYCQQCKETYYLNVEESKCFLCSSYISNCQTCSTNAQQCLSCIAETKTQLIDFAVCQPCNSSSVYNQTNKRCYSCLNQFQNCISCDVTQGIFTCFQCNNNYQIYQQNSHDCQNCIFSAFLDIDNKKCSVCPKLCGHCVSSLICASCVQTHHISSILLNQDCIQCNRNNSDLTTQLPFCSIQFETNCLFSSYNMQLKKCQYSSSVRTAVYLFSAVTSLTILHSVFQQISILIGLFDDFFYFTFHQRNYSKVVESFFNQMTNFTLSRFKPQFLSGVYQMMRLEYADRTFNDKLAQPPLQFMQNGGGIYFIDTTQDLWLGSIPIFIVVLIVLSCLRWIINLIARRNIVPKYNILGIIVITFMESNLQYFSFRCFSQLYQIVPLGYLYYLNLLICYFILLLSMLYALGGLLLYKIVYKKINDSKYFTNNKGKAWIVWWVCIHSTKIITGFIHAYFYFHLLSQSIALLIVFTAKAVLFIIYAKYLKPKTQYVFESIPYLLFIVLQFFFIAEIVMKMSRIHTVEYEIYIGNIQHIIIITMIIFQLISLFSRFLVTGVTYLIKKNKKSCQKSTPKAENIQIIQNIIVEPPNVEMPVSILKQSSFMLIDVQNESSITPLNPRNTRKKTVQFLSIPKNSKPQQINSPNTSNNNNKQNQSKKNKKQQMRTQQFKDIISMISSKLKQNRNFQQ